MEGRLKKMDYFWNTFLGSLIIGAGTWFQVKSGIFLTSIADVKTSLELVNVSLSIIAYITGIAATCITISKFLKERKSKK